MEQYQYDEKNGLWYELAGDYYIPCLTVPEMDNIGIWGERRRQYLKQHKNGVYTGMRFAGTLAKHLRSINAQAVELYERLVSEMAQLEGVTEECKASDQLEWVRQMNNISARASEVVREELIYD